MPMLYNAPMLCKAADLSRHTACMHAHQSSCGAASLCLGGITAGTYSTSKVVSCMHEVGPTNKSMGMYAKPNAAACRRSRVLNPRQKHALHVTPAITLCEHASMRVAARNRQPYC